MSGKIIFLLLGFLVISVSGCSASEIPLPTVQPTLTAEPQATPAEPQATPAEPSTRTLIGDLSPGDILIQRDLEPGLLRPEMHYPFGRVAPFTLYADGTLIYQIGGGNFGAMQLMQVQLPPDEVVNLVEEVWNAGFERLESHTDECKSGPGGVVECLMDAGTVVLRARTPQGDLHEVKIYGNFANDPEAFDSIRNLLDNYRRPGAGPYVPKVATLFISEIHQIDNLPQKDWPLDPEMLTWVVEDSPIWARVLEGPALEDYLAAIRRNMGEDLFQFDGRFYSVFLVPWLPGVDYRGAISEAFPVPPGADPTPN